MVAKCYLVVESFKINADFPETGLLEFGFQSTM